MSASVESSEHQNRATGVTRSAGTRGESLREAPVELEIERLRAEVRAATLPTHVGIIMDGNGRWAETRGMGRLAGHREGSRSVREVTRAARKLGLEWLTLYAFSSQNWARPPEEVAGLMDLLAEFLESERDEILDNDVRLNAVGELDRLPPRVREPLEALRAESSRNRGLTLTLALSYGGREELVHAVQSVAREVADGVLAADAVDADVLRARLWTADMPDPDLVVRTSGELRLSNFLLFQIAYSEIVVTDTAWPDFRERELLLALREFQCRERRFGLTGAQTRNGS